jgi:response regulator RpfG family c-di-GMP phosphodiesterase
VTGRTDAPGDAPTVLIVDDEPRVLDALEAILAAEFRVLRAAGGEAALEILRAEEVAVIVTDYRMPGMTGVELLRRSQEHAPDTVRIILTAYTDVDSLMEAINRSRGSRTTSWSSCVARPSAMPSVARTRGFATSSRSPTTRRAASFRPPARARSPSRR